MTTKDDKAQAAQPQEPVAYLLEPIGRLSKLVARQLHFDRPISGPEWIVTPLGPIASHPQTAQPQDCIEAKRGDATCVMCDDGRPEYCLYAKGAAPAAQVAPSVLTDAKKPDAYILRDGKERRLVWSITESEMSSAYPLYLWANGMDANHGLYLHCYVQGLQAIEQNRAAPSVSDVLSRALERMDRARRILTDGKPTAACNWGMLDTADLRTMLATAPSVSADAGGQKPFGYFHELLNHEGKGTGVWLGCAKQSVVEQSHIEGETGKEIVPLYVSTSASVSADATLHRIADVFSIGSEARTPETILANIENAARRSKCLSEIEREFFTTTTQDDDGEEHDECPLNWGADPAEYVEQFRAAIAAKSKD